MNRILKIEKDASEYLLQFAFNLYFYVINIILSVCVCAQFILKSHFPVLQMVLKVIVFQHPLRDTLIMGGISIFRRII